MTRILAMLAALTTLVACETAQGFGQDVESAGEAISEEAREAQ